MQRQRLLIVGYGDTAEHALPYLAPRYRVLALTRDREKAKRLSCAGVQALVGDLDRPAGLARLSGLAHAVLHLAPPPNHGIVDARTRNLIAALGRAQSLPYRLVYISTTGVYGDCSGQWVEETLAASPASERAQRRLDAERRLRAWGAASGVKVSILRVPGIYGPNRLPLQRLRAATPALTENDDVYTNHIHIEDLARACAAALARAQPARVYNCNDDSALKMGEYFDLVADHFGIARAPRLARADIATQVPPALLSFMSESRRMRNLRLKRELRLRLRYPSVREGLAGLDER